MIRIIDAPGAAPTLFPEPDLHQLLGYVRLVWDDLRLNKPVWWNLERETKLVAGFYKALINDERLMQHGISFGRLILEASDVDFDANGMPKYRGRTDIQFAHGGPMSPALVFEFKRLNNKGHLRGSYVTQGVARFVSGQYSPESDFGIMVGLVLGSAAAEQAHLTKHLSKPTVAAAFGGQIMSSSAHWAASQYAPALDFDTLHNRAAGCATPQIQVGHMLLER